MSTPITAGNWAEEHYVMWNCGEQQNQLILHYNEAKKPFNGKWIL